MNSSTTDNAIESNVMTHLAFRSAVVAGLFTAYSTLYLRKSISPQVLQNAAIASAASVAAESAMRYAVGPALSISKANGLNSIGMIGAEAALSGLLFSKGHQMLFGSAVPIQQLAITGALLDGAAQVLGPKLSNIVTGNPNAY